MGAPGDCVHGSTFSGRNSVAAFTPGATSAESASPPSIRRRGNTGAVLGSGIGGLDMGEPGDSRVRAGGIAAPPGVEEARCEKLQRGTQQQINQTDEQEYLHGINHQPVIDLI